MTEVLSIRDALCKECCSETCVFAQDDFCRLPLVTGKLPVYEENYGCRAWIGKEEGWLERGQETIIERVGYLWACICKMLEYDNSPNGTSFFVPVGIKVVCKKPKAPESLAYFFNMIAQSQVLDYEEGQNEIWLNERTITLRNTPEDKDPRKIWMELCTLAELNKQRYEGDTFCPVWSDGDMFFVNDPEVADAVADLFDAIGTGCCGTGYYDPEEDKKAGTEDELTGYWYIDC